MNNFEADQYLRNVLEQRANVSCYSPKEEEAFNHISRYVKEWMDTCISQSGYAHTAWILANTIVTHSVQKSGSRAKGTSIKGKSDLDIFISINDPGDRYSPEQYSESLYNFFKRKFPTARRQNVSTGIVYNGFDIDITVAKRIKRTVYTGSNSYNDHYLFLSKDPKPRRMQTNIETHINFVRQSGRLQEIKLMKIWKARHDLDIPSIYLEVLIVETLRGDQSFTLAERLIKIFSALQYVESKQVIDPANSANNIAESIPNAEKRRIKQVASDCRTLASIGAWNSVIW